MQDSPSDKERAYAEARARIFAQQDESAAPSATQGNVGDDYDPDSEYNSSGVIGSGNSRNAASSQPGRGVINTSEKKVAYRDRQAEMYDPDFVRQGSQPSLSAPGYDGGE